MATQSLIPAAEYVRMSTEEQPNSIMLQQAEIQRYAAAHGYQVVVTYADPGRSGIEIKHRPGLRQLIQDVVGGQTRFRAILVYDVSRWGRFQDTDESAHYEFLCRSAGVPLHYCAEQFENNGMLPNDIMKALKRTMAAEYSRELAAKVVAGQRRLVAQGFRVGATPGYGYRRMMISADGRPKQILQSQERKNLKSDRVILIPGPRHEVEVIRTIFALAAERRESPRQIAQELNRRGIQYLDGQPWNTLNVYLILKNDKYMGSNVWGKTNKTFSKFTRRLPRDAWITNHNAFVPLVSAEQFARVQDVMQTRNYKVRKPDSHYLEEMKRVLARAGKLSQKLLRKNRAAFDHRAYLRRFGSMMRAYELIGYHPSTHAFRSVEAADKMKRLRQDLLNRLDILFPSQMRIIKRNGQTHRRTSKLDNDVQIAVQICRPLAPTVDGKPRWMLIGQRKEDGLPALICLCDKSMSEFTGFYVVPEFGDLIKRNKAKVLREVHPWLAAGKRLESLTQFYEVAKEVAGNWQPQDDIMVVGDVVLTGRTSTIIVSGKEITLSRIEAALFKLLVHNADCVVPHSDFSRCFNEPRDYFPRAHISGLRRKLGKRLRERIVTVKGEGYLYQTNDSR